MESAKRRSQRDYTLTFKLSVVDQVEKGELSYKEALCTKPWNNHSRPWQLGLQLKISRDDLRKLLHSRKNKPLLDGYVFSYFKLNKVILRVYIVSEFAIEFNLSKLAY